MAYYVDVSHLDKKYADARTDDFDLVPDGNYRAVINKGAFRNVGKNKEPIFEWVFEITSGEYSGSRLQKTNFLRSDEQFKYLKIDMSKCRVKWKTLSEIQQHAQDLTGIDVEIKVTTRTDNPDRQNVYIVKRITEDVPEPPRQRDEPPPPDDSDIPF